MSQHIPAWKRIGLKVREELSEDPLAITPHLESSTVTNKQAKKLNKQKRKLEEAVSSGSEKKKPPKRVKVPKSERAPPPEKDQLSYLRQYEVDNDNWKFSKQKQNWILKNIRNIPEEYETALQSYLGGLQGGSRDRLILMLKEVIYKWNVIAEETEKKVEEELREDSEKKENINDTNNSGDKQEVKDNEKKQNSEDKDDAPDYNYAVRCRSIIKLLTDEILELKGVDMSSNDEVQQTENDQVDTKKKSESETNEISDDEAKEIINKEEQPSEEQDNLIIEEVEVSGLVSESTAEPESQEISKGSKIFNKKSSSSKKKKRANK